MLNRALLLHRLANRILIGQILGAQSRARFFRCEERFRLTRSYLNSTNVSLLCKKERDKHGKCEMFHNYKSINTKGFIFSTNIVVNIINNNSTFTKLEQTLSFDFLNMISQRDILATGILVRAKNNKKGRTDWRPSIICKIFLIYGRVTKPTA
ncbi:hypothetical protein BOO29_05070 [Vibrio navarrensis]|nr:hypothetical protein [Vibrio navarrensis]